MVLFFKWLVFGIIYSIIYFTINYIWYKKIVNYYKEKKRKTFKQLLKEKQ